MVFETGWSVKPFQPLEKFCHTAGGRGWREATATNEVRGKRAQGTQKILDIGKTLQRDRVMLRWGYF
jgi:hypothetical protein